MDAVSNGQGCSVRLRNLTIGALFPGVAGSPRPRCYTLATAGEHDSAQRGGRSLITTDTRTMIRAAEQFCELHRPEIANLHANVELARQRLQSAVTMSMQVDPAFA